MNRAELRATMPTVAALIDAMAAEFGRDQFRVVFAAENGVSVGTERVITGIVPPPPIQKGKRK
jgi:hypothetical protein